MTEDPATQPTRFHTVNEAAELLRVDPVTLYRAIRANSFPAVKIRGRYVIPAKALAKIADDATDLLSCVNVADYVLLRRDDEAPRRPHTG